MFRFKDGQHRQIAFTDEIYFTIEQTLNSQNDRTWSIGPPPKDSRMVQRAVKPKGVMVSALVGHGVKGPLIFVPAGLKIDNEVYRERVLKPLLEVLQTQQISLSN
jgi:hypothetical protein